MKIRFIDLFKKIPTKSDIRKNFKTSKNYNLKLLSNFKLECYSISKEFYIDKRVISNFFEYLCKNMNVKNIQDVQKVVYNLVDINNILEQLLSISCVQSDDSIQCINYIKNNVYILLIKIAEKLNIDAKDLVKKSLFNKIMYDLFNKRNLKEVLYTLTSNVNILNYNDFNGKTFDELLYNNYLNALKFNNKGLIEYYINLIKYVVLIPTLTIDRQKYYDILNSYNFSNVNLLEKKNPISEKIDSLNYNEKSGRYLLFDEFIFSFDSCNTKKIDDAFSIDKYDDGYLIGIHIADVYSVGFNEKIILENEQYLSSSGYSVASLSQGNIKNSISLFVDIDKNGIIKDYRLLKTKLRVRCNLENEQVENFLLSDKINLSNNDKKLLMEKINHLLTLYTLIDNTNLITYPDAHNLASSIVAKFMMLYNCIISSFFLDSNYPFIYLNGTPLINEFSTINKGYSTGFNEFSSYSRATSPIIDKASCVSQVLLNKFYFENPSDKEIGKYEKMLKPIVEKLNCNRQ